MSRTKNNTKKPTSKAKSNDNSIGPYGRYGKYNFRDLQRKAILLGMPFPDVIESDSLKLIGYIEKHDHETENKELLVQYDDWMDGILELRGITRFPTLRLSYVSSEEDVIAGKMVRKKSRKAIRKPKEPKEKKPPRERDEFNLIKGTKKSYVFSLVKRGKPDNKIIERTIKKFPDANPKSITIWIRKASKEINN